MAADVSDRLGKTQLAGAFVVGKGFVRRKALSNAGGVIGAAADYVGAKTAAGGDAPDFKGLAYLAVTADEVVLFKARQGFKSPSVTEQLATLPRAEIESSEFRSGYLSHLKLNLQDGGSWEFEVQRSYKKSGVALAEVLGAVSP